VSELYLSFPRGQRFSKYCVVFVNTEQLVYVLSVSLVQLKKRFVCIRGLHFILFIRGHVAKWMFERSRSTTRQLGQF